MATKAQIDDLRQHLGRNKQIKIVFFDKTGGWVFHKAHGEHLSGVNREDIMEDDYYPEGVDADKKAATAVVKMNAKDTIAAINAAATATEVEELILVEERKSVLDAATAKLATFAKVDDGLE